MNTRKDKIAQSFVQLLPLIYSSLNQEEVNKVPSKQSDLTHLQSHILESLIHVNEGVSISDLAKKINISKQQMTPIVQKLEEKGYIVKVRDVNDKRSFKIMLSEAGKETITARWTELYHLFCEKLDQLSDEDQGDLEYALYKINRILEKLN
ncbi:MarR family transcriptional regulator [Bacillus sp. DX4.1]|uniref:MarR family winged helix-turn-helix transcriptional regulator n=1 Tax=Bacillus sp. DX4.1 TaxID=3055867 RepID=UPI0025A0920F|nr:MarR family transcriptional regulator [Bacillus sp. DX4.1]MDM5190247.1 MarR family transcriptional regulator [Bacillus sp. DX4.1]